MVFRPLYPLWPTNTVQYNKNKFASSLASGHVDVLLWLHLDRLLGLVVYQLEHHLLGPQQESELLHLLLVQSRGEAGDIREGLGRRVRHIRMQKSSTAVQSTGSGWVTWGRWGSVCTGSCESGRKLWITGGMGVTVLCIMDHSFFAWNLLSGRVSNHYQSVYQFSMVRKHFWLGSNL